MRNSMFNRPTSIIQAMFTLILFSFLGSIFFLVGAPVNAEGSVDITGDGGNRPYLEAANGTNAGILRRTIIKVYVNTNEEINLGSSTYASRTPTQDIIWTAPSGATGSCDVILNGVGHISTRAMEVSGPLPSPGGYTPCTVVAAETGIYDIEFRGPTLNGDPPNTNILVTAAFPVVGTNATVAAWDVTVHSDATVAGIPISGRVFTNYLALNMGSNNRALNSNLFVITNDGYQYQINLNGIDPYAFLFFSNTKGPTLAGNPLYQSVQLIGANPGQLPPGITIRNPNSADDDANYELTHKIFFNLPDPTLPTLANSPSGQTWLLNPPENPPVPSNLRFEGSEAGTTGQMGTAPLGGNFLFDVNRNSSFSIGVDIDGNGIYGDNNDRVLTGIALTGTNTIAWDGLDGAGNPVAASNIAYQAEVITYAGEVHFPFIDPENHPNGLIFQRRVDPGSNPAAPDPFTFYYDDAYNYTGTNTYEYSLCAGAGDATGPNDPPAALVVGLPGVPLGCYGVGPAPRDASNGIISGTSITVGGEHEWTTNFGDRRIIETWTFYPSGGSAVGSGILVTEVDLAIVKTAVQPQVTVGGTVTFNIVVTNNGPSHAVGANVADTFPAYLTNVTWTCAAAGTASCTASGTGNINDTVNINAGAGNSVTYTVNATIDSSAPNPISNTATVTRPPDANETNTTNNTSTVTVPVVNLPQMTVSKDDGRTVVSSTGETVTYTISYQNIGSADAANVTLSDALPAGATFVSCSNACAGAGPVTWTIGTVAVGATGSVTLTVNLPAAAPPATHVNTVTLSYTDTGGTPQTDVTATDTDIVQVVISPPQMTVSKDDGQTIVSSNGQQVTYTITYSNVSVVSAANVTLSDALPTGATFVSCSNACTGIGPVNWTIGTVAAGASGNVTLTVNLPAAVPPATHVNTVTLSYTDSVGNPQPDETDDDIDTVQVPSTTPLMTVSKDDGRTLVSSNGEQVTYTISYSNISLADAANVTFADDLPVGATFVSCSGGCTGTGPVNWTIGTVAAGASGNVTLTVNLPAVAPPATHVNTVTLSYTDTSGNPQTDETDSDIDTVQIVSSVPIMVVNKDDGRTVVSASGEQVTYTITYSNVSSTAAANVSLTDNLPVGATFVSCSNTCTGTGPVAWTIGTVAASTSGSVTLTVNLPAATPPATHINTVTLSYTDTSGNPQPDESDDDTDTVQVSSGVPVMIVNKDDGLTLVSSNGEQVTYTITYTNISTTDAFNVTLSDNLPSGAGFVSCSGNCLGTGPVVWTIGSVAAAASGSVTLTVNLPAASPLTSHVNTVTLSYTDSVGNPQADVTDDDIDTIRTDDVPGPTPTGTLPTIPPQLTVSGTPQITPQGTISFTPPDANPYISKQANPPFALPGEEIQWIITVTNPSNLILKDIIVTDKLSDDLQILGISGGGTIKQNGQQITWLYPTLGPGESVSLTITTSVRADVRDPFVENVAVLRNPSPLGEYRLILPPRSTARVLFVTSLPATGESPQWHGALVAITFFTVLFGCLFGIVAARHMRDEEA